MAVTDLTNTTWLFNSEIGFPEELMDITPVSITFVSAGTEFTHIAFNTTRESMHYGNDDDPEILETGAYAFSTWTEENYRTIQITGGTDAANLILIEWLEENATQVIPSYTITPNLTNISSSNTNYEIEDGDTWTTTLTADAGYVLPESITVVGATASYSATTGVLTLSNPTGDVTFTASAVEIVVPDDKELVTYEDLEVFKNKIVALILQNRCGYYDPNIMYNIGDSVFYNKQIYVCISNTLGGVPPTNTTYWTPLVVNE